MKDSKQRTISILRTVFFSFCLDTGNKSIDLALEPERELKDTLARNAEETLEEAFLEFEDEDKTEEPKQIIENATNIIKGV